MLSPLPRIALAWAAAAGPVLCWSLVVMALQEQEEDGGDHGTEEEEDEEGMMRVWGS